MPEPPVLHIFVNRRKFEEGDGVTSEMTGAQIAALVDVPADNAVIRRDTGPSRDEIAPTEIVSVKLGDHFLVTRKIVEAGYARERIDRELARLSPGGLRAELHIASRPVVLYRDVPTGGGRIGLSPVADVLVPVPEGYPAALIDLAGLPVGSPFLPLVKGGTNNQGIVVLNGQSWQLASYHPHNGGGGAPWDQTRHGFHTYVDHLIAWLDRLG